MGASHIEFLVEEPSMENFLHALLPRIMPDGSTYVVHAFQGKADLLSKIEARLRGYASFIPDDWCIVVVVDRDDDDCKELKNRIEKCAIRAGLTAKSSGRAQWNVATRIVIEELEAWYFGDWQAVKTAYPRVPATIDKQQAYRNPDSIRGGTWEAFERVMRRYGYFSEGLPKLSAARAIGAHIDPGRSSSASFAAFFDAVRSALN